jgi:galactokinase
VPATPRHLAGPAEDATSSDGAGRVVRAFRDHFGEPAAVVRSPGRINLIGEHTDHNLGFVLPGAVDRAIFLALRLRDDRALRFFALDKAEHHAGSLDELRPVTPQWPSYLLGILSELQAMAIELRGVDCVFGGDVPIGSGMSSSAALECGFAFGINELVGAGLSRVALAELSQRSENRFVGVNCGIMDQFASCLGQPQRLIRLDCRDLSYAYVPFERDDVRLVLCDSQLPRALTSSAYNLRRAQCEEGVAQLARHHPEIRSLRDASPELIEAIRDELDPAVYRRCAYVVAENQRVLAVCAALERGDLRAVGAAMNATQEGLAHGYEVSCPELDVLASEAQALPGVLGARMMGAGFGGCTINLVETDHLAAFHDRMAVVFRDRLGKPAVCHVCKLGPGTERVG